MKKTLPIAIITSLIIIFFATIVYFQLSLQKTQRDYQVKIESLNQGISRLEKQVEKNQQEKEIAREWSTYKNNDHDFSFKYPADWKDSGRKIEIDNYFTKNPQVGVLQLELLKQDQSLVKITEDEIKKRNCPPDHVIENSESGLMYVTYCGASTEKYNYLFKNKQGKIIQLSYHDDFDSNWSEEKKLEKFKLIVDTISLF